MDASLSCSKSLLAILSVQTGVQSHLAGVGMPHHSLRVISAMCVLVVFLGGEVAGIAAAMFLHSPVD